VVGQRTSVGRRKLKIWTAGERRWPEERDDERARERERERERRERKEMKDKR